MYNKQHPNRPPLEDKSEEATLVKDLKDIFEIDPEHFKSERKILAAYYRYKLGDAEAVRHNAERFLLFLHDGRFNDPFTVIRAWLRVQMSNEKYRTKNYEEVRLKYATFSQEFIGAEPDDVEEGDDNKNN